MPERHFKDGQRDMTCLKETLLIWKRCGVTIESAGPEANLLIVIVCFMSP